MSTSATSTAEKHPSHVIDVVVGDNRLCFRVSFTRAGGVSANDHQVSVQEADLCGLLQVLPTLPSLCVARLLWCPRPSEELF